MTYDVMTSLSRRGFLAGLIAASAATLAGHVDGGRPAAPALAQPAAPTPHGDPDALFAEFDAYLTRRMAELRVPGLAAGVIAGDREHVAGFGVTSVDHPQPVDAHTIFQIGSTTKTVTATALMRLIERGELDLEAPVRTYLPDFRVADADVSETVRLRHLVTHTAGWNDDALTRETGDGDDALASMVAGLADVPQVTPLGRYYSYNNGAVCVAGRVIEAVTDQTYEAAVADLVLKPLGLKDASFFPEEIITRGFAVGHAAPPDNPAGDPVVLEPWGLARCVNPAGGMAASVADQVRYARFHLGDGTANGARVLSTDGLARMQTPLGPGGSTPLALVENVGVIWQLQTRGGARLVSHAGGTYGQQSNLVLVPEHGFAVTVLTNAAAGAVLATEATDWAVERFLGLTPPVLQPISLPPDRQADYVGDYTVPANGGTIRVGAGDGVLRLTQIVPGQDQPALESDVHVIGDDLVTMQYMGVPIFGDFVRDDAGKVAWIRFMGRMVPRAG
jgi:CubicO group peptidase (beta-lactamase class C family)